jgi:hypothetical protein
LKVKADILDGGFHPCKRDAIAMELLCPSCQRKLTIPEQYAGQQMKCPLCNNMFTAPALAPVP